MDARRIPFAPEDEERIASVGLWGMIIAIASIASSILSAVISLIMASRIDLPSSLRSITLFIAFIPGLIVVAIGVLLGIWLLQASLAFRKVALTDEADEHYLLLGFCKLRNYFMTIGILIIIGLVGATLVFCGALTCGAMLR